jgi:dTDP-4-dehydrorhamnose 3,5-epimerase-like enzyme
MSKIISLDTFELSKQINLTTFSDNRGSITIIDKSLPFDIKRVYYIYDAKGIRGGHRHKKTRQAIICLSGKFELFLNNGKEKKSIILNRPDKCIILEPEDWHQMRKFSKKIIILVLASEHYSADDYIDEAYKN